MCQQEILEKFKIFQKTLLSMIIKHVTVSQLS